MNKCVYITNDGYCEMLSDDEVQQPCLEGPCEIEVLETETDINEFKEAKNEA